MRSSCSGTMPTTYHHLRHCPHPHPAHPPHLPDLLLAEAVPRRPMHQHQRHVEVRQVGHHVVAAPLGQLRGCISVYERVSVC